MNLHLRLQNSLGLRMWDIVSLCPNLAYLCFDGSERNASRIPTSIGATPNNIFRTLTRVMMRAVKAESVPTLVQALNSAAAAVSLTARDLRLEIWGPKVNLRCRAWAIARNLG